MTSRPTFSPELLDELHILALFDLSTTREGLKIHQHDADPNMVAAARRLFDKGLISQGDGGYLTSLGLDAAEHAQALIRILSPD